MRLKDDKSQKNWVQTRESSDQIFERYMWENVWGPLYFIYANVVLQEIVTKNKGVAEKSFSEKTPNIDQNLFMEAMMRQICWRYKY